MKRFVPTKTEGQRALMEIMAVLKGKGGGLPVFFPHALYFLPASSDLLRLLLVFFPFCPQSWAFSLSSIRPLKASTSFQHISVSFVSSQVPHSPSILPALSSSCFTHSSPSASFNVSRQSANGIRRSHGERSRVQAGRATAQVEKTRACARAHMLSKVCVQIVKTMYSQSESTTPQQKKEGLLAPLSLVGMHIQALKDRYAGLQRQIDEQAT